MWSKRIAAALFDGVKWVQRHVLSPDDLIARELRVEDTFEAWVNPLQWIEVDVQGLTASSVDVDGQSLLRFLTNPSEAPGLEEAIQRYRKINALGPPIFVAPNHDHFLEKLVWPLRSAKSSYVIGNYISTIAQCGMVAEMVAMLWFRITPFRLGDKLLTERLEGHLFGSSFERLGQERRVAILYATEVISDDQKNSFDIVRAVRRRYLHYFSHAHASIQTDALRAYEASLNTMAALLDLSLEGTRVKIRPELMSYVERINQDDP